MRGQREAKVSFPSLPAPAPIFKKYDGSYHRSPGVRKACKLRATGKGHNAHTLSHTEGNMERKPVRIHSRACAEMLWMSEGALPFRTDDRENNELKYDDK